jgi:uncharacterized membrane-anchored protein
VSVGFEMDHYWLQEAQAGLEVEQTVSSERQNHEQAEELTEFEGYEVAGKESVEVRPGRKVEQKKELKED